MDIITFVFVFLFGIVIGSFLNVCIYRIPKGENVAVTSSHCMSCNHKLAWYDLFPVFSYLFLGGKCRYCKVKLSAQYPLIETLNGILYVIIFLRYGISSTMVLLCLCASAMIVLSVIDQRTMEIPEKINIFIFILGIINLILDYKNWSLYLIGFVAVSGFLLIIFIISKGRGIGGGDIKLMAAAGLLLGYKLIIIALIIGCILGSAIHLIIMALKKGERMFAFGPYLSLGIFISMIFGESLLNMYINFLVL